MVGLLEVGHIDRSHGLRGEVIVTLTTDYTERLAAGAVLVTDAGSLRVETDSGIVELDAGEVHLGR